MGIFHPRNVFIAFALWGVIYFMSDAVGEHCGGNFDHVGDGCYAMNRWLPFDEWFTPALFSAPDPDRPAPADPGPAPAAPDPGPAPAPADPDPAPGPDPAGSSPSQADPGPAAPDPTPSGDPPGESVGGSEGRTDHGKGDHSAGKGRGHDRGRGHGESGRGGSEHGGHHK